MSPKKKTPNKEGVQRSIRVTPECDALWDALSAKFGISKTGIAELAIRRMAEQEKVTADTKEEG